MNMTDALKMIGLAIDAVNAIRRIAASAVDRPQHALEAIRSIGDAVTDGFAGKTDPEIVAKDIEAAFRHALGANDAAADAALREKFDR